MFRSRLLAGAAGLTILAGCSSLLGIGSAPGLRAGAVVVGDEPYAVKAGAAILTQGGNAVDAATSIYFALAVTYPVAAGLGGGGICMVHDSASGQNEEIDFLARDAGGTGAYAIPGNVRGFAMMQTAYGALPWQKVISPAEGYAAAGFPISHALATRLGAAQNVVRLDAGLAAEFMDESGHTKAEGTIVSNRELAETLSAIRVNGADEVYKGDVASKIVSYSGSQDGSIAQAALAGYLPQRNSPRMITMGEQYLLLPGSRTGAGAFSGALFEQLVRAQTAPNATNNTEAAVADATMQALKAFQITDLPTDLGATGFSAVDERGLAVACAVTMNGPFGSGHTAQGTGITLARAPSSGPAGLSVAFLTPVVATDKDGQLLLAGAGAGGPVGTASMADALVRLGKGEIVTRRGSTRGITLYDTVNAIVCQNRNCTALPDAGASGMGAAVPSP
jgi:gamma-glutamyltranspeptidase/glutathione hydrolase